MIKGMRVPRWIIEMSMNACVGVVKGNNYAKPPTPLSIENILNDSVTAARVLSIASRTHANSLHALWPIRTPCPTCANQDA